MVEEVWGRWSGITHIALTTHHCQLGYSALEVCWMGVSFVVVVCIVFGQVEEVAESRGMLSRPHSPLL